MLSILLILIHVAGDLGDGGRVSVLIWTVCGCELWSGFVANGGFNAPFNDVCVCYVFAYYCY